LQPSLLILQGKITSLLFHSVYN